MIGTVDLVAGISLARVLGWDVSHQRDVCFMVDCFTRAAMGLCGELGRNVVVTGAM